MSAEEAMTLEMPTMHCPGCGAEHPDYDGLGFIAHTEPAYPMDACGWCSHPMRNIDRDGNARCTICNQTWPAEAP